MPARRENARSTCLAFLALGGLAIPGFAGLPASAVTPRSDEPDGADRIRAAAAVRERLERFRSEHPFPGASFALLLPDGTELAVTAGVTDTTEEGRALTPADRFLAGSVGKTYVVGVALKLVQAGRLDLDRRASDYLEDVPVLKRLPNGDRVTLRQLLRHQSGMPRYVFAEEFWEQLLEQPDKEWHPAELLGFVADTEPLFPPGEGWAYADTNYLVVGLVLERVAEKPFYGLVQELLLDPAGLTDTIPSDRRRIDGLVQGHVVMARGLGVPERVLEDGRMVFNPQFEGCGGGFATTPADLARWARRLWSEEHSCLGERLAEVRETVPATELGPDRRYGLGLIESPTPLGLALGHDGFMPGYLTTVAWYPEHAVAAALQLNTDDGRALGRPAHIALAELVGLALEALGPRPGSRAEDTGR